VASQAPGEPVQGEQGFSACAADVSEYMTASEAGSERGKRQHRGCQGDRPSVGREGVGRSFDQEDREPAGCREEDPDPPADAGHQPGSRRPWADASSDRPPMPPQHSASVPLPPRGPPVVPIPGELFQQFREMCLPEKLSARIKSADTMENAWIRLEAWFGDKGLFIKDLMQDIKSVTPIKEGDKERMMDYYVTLQAHIKEARKVGALEMLLIPANVELMVLPLTAWEKRIWREAQGRLPAEDSSWYMDVFVNKRLRYAINMVATSERHVLPKATPFHRSQRSPSSEGRGGQYSRPGSFGRNAKVMAVTESRSADRKKVRFPPPKAWDPEAKWTQDCVMFTIFEVVV
jgi:hypothetical protein